MLETQKNIRQIFFDTETTGLNKGHRILEIACVEAIDRSLTHNNLHFLINPQRDIDEEATSIHGITYEQIKDQPVFADVVERFLDYVKNAELIIHNAAFDVDMVNYELELLRQQGKDYGKLEDHCLQITDTVVIARKKVKSGRRSLDALCKKFGIDNTDRILHNALLDSQLLFEVYIAMTGGQQELFGERGQKKVSVNTTKPLEDYRNYDLPKVIVSDQELLQHQEFMQKIVKVT